jgi:general secretion pathway protein D
LFIKFGNGLCLMLMICIASVTAQDSKGVMFDFSEIEIRSFVKVVSELTGENFVIDPSVSGNITVTSPSPIPKEAVSSVFRTVLNVYGFAAVPDGPIVKIVPASRAKQSGNDIATGRQDPTGLIETRIITLKLIDGHNLKGLLQPLLTRAGHMAVHAATNTVIMTDESRNLSRLTSIIQALDHAGPEFSLDIIPLDHAVSEDLADTLMVLFATNRSAGGVRPVFIGDSRANILLMNAPASLLEDIKRVVSKLDVPLPQEQARIRVIHVENSDAQAIASVLNNQLNQLTDSADSKNSPTSGDKDKSTIIIGAEPTTNSLIVTASPKDHPVIEEVIRKLDIPRHQILVEALIVEMSTGLTRDLGLEWRLTNAIDEDEYSMIGGTNLPTEGTSGDLQQTRIDPYNFPSGLVMGLVKGTISFGGVEIANIGALARAMEGTSGVNILSTPHILTLDNEEAEIIVGEERPFLKSSQTTDAGGTVKTYEFKDIGLTMKITPRITRDNMVMLKLFQEIKNFIAESDIGAVTTSKRQARTTIRIQNNQIAVIGGLLKEDTLERSSRVPCLGTLPLLGYLFKADSRNSSKSNLLIFITPHIIQDPAGLKDVTSRYKESIESADQSREMKVNSSDDSP